MREQPPPQLIALLENLGLATAAQVHRMSGRVGRLARDLPRFESVWVDALAQQRILTPLQAAEINAGRGRRLRVGPYVLCESLPWPYYAAGYRARQVGTSESVRLTIVENRADRGEEIAGGLQTLLATSKKLRSEYLCPIDAVAKASDDQESRLWAASPWIEGRTAAEWMVHDGRFPPQVVLEIARAMLAGLVELERAGSCHGDIGASGLVLTQTGGAVLVQPGLRGIVRPEEGYAHADLLPEAFDYLPPERITDGTGPSIAGDIYACGCLWWHLLCGRPPLSGGSSLEKLRWAQAAKIVDPRRFAPEVPTPLGTATAACLRREPSQRPESMARLAAMLGSPTRCGQTALARCLTRTGTPTARWAVSARAVRQSNHAPLWMTALAGCLVAAVAMLWPMWRDRTPVAALSGAGESDTMEVATLHQQPSLLENSADGQPAAMEDAAVVPAVYEQVATDETGTKPEDLILAADEPLRLESLPLKAGQCVRGDAGRRPLLMVPRTGLPVDVDDVRFENVDFAYDHPAQLRASAEMPCAIVLLRASRIELVGCRLQTLHPTSASPAALCWDPPADPSQSVLRGGRVRLINCVLHDVAVGVDCRMVGTAALEIVNTLQIGGGPLVRLDRAPSMAEPIRIHLKQVTTRGSGPLIECLHRPSGETPVEISGEISVESVACAFVPRSGTALMLFHGPASPDAMLRGIRWTGQGSLVSPETAVAAWRDPDGVDRPLDDADVSIAGLVRSQIEFAGGDPSDPAASQLIRWQAPLRSPDPPGIDPAELP